MNCWKAGACSPAASIRIGKNGAGGYLNELALKSDGKTLVGGNWGGYSEVCRYAAGGSPDLSLDSDSVVHFDELSNAIGGRSAAMLPDRSGKITLLLDHGDSSGSYSDPVRLVRLNVNGSLDTSFGTSGQVSLAPFGDSSQLGAIMLNDGRLARFAGEELALAGPRIDFGLGPNGTLFITGTSGANTISITLSGTTVHAIRNGTEQTWALADVKRLDILTDTGDDVITVSAPLPALIESGAGNDSIDLAGANGSTVLAGDGNDTVIGSARGDSIDGGDGNDILGFGFNSGTILGGAGDDAINSPIGAMSISAGAGNDLIHAAGRSGETPTVLGEEAETPSIRETKTTRPSAAPTRTSSTPGTTSPTCSTAVTAPTPASSISSLTW